MAASAHVRFELESRAENVALIRSAVAAFGQVEHLDLEQIADIQTAISEACNNVIQHAYGDGTGLMIVTLEAAEATIAAVIRDFGRGIAQPSAGEAADDGGGVGHLGLGLGLMTALTDRLEVLTPAEGTEVRLCFDRAADVDAVSQRPGDAWLQQVPMSLDGDAVVWMQPASLLAPVFGRVLRAYAAASRFRADRADELPEVGQALSDFAAQAGDGHLVGVAIAASTHRLGLVSGPFPNADRVDGRIQPEVRMEQLVEELDLTRIDGQTIISFTLNDRPGVPAGS